MANVGARAYLHGDGVWVSGTIATNPGAAAVLATTGAITGTSYYLVGCSVAARNPAGTTAIDFVYDFILYASDGSTPVYSQRRVATGQDDFILPSKIPIANGQMLKCVTVPAITGEFQASIFYMETA